MKDKILEILKNNIDDVLLLLGTVCITASATMISLALGLFVLGAFLIIIGYLISS